MSNHPTQAFTKALSEAEERRDPGPLVGLFGDRSSLGSIGFSHEFSGTEGALEF